MCVCVFNVFISKHDFGWRLLVWRDHVISCDLWPQHTSPTSDGQVCLRCWPHWPKTARAQDSGWNRRNEKHLSCRTGHVARNLKKHTDLVFLGLRDKARESSFRSFDVAFVWRVMTATLWIKRYLDLIAGRPSANIHFHYLDRRRCLRSNRAKVQMFLGAFKDEQQAFYLVFFKITCNSLRLQAELMQSLVHIPEVHCDLHYRPGCFLQAWCHIWAPEGRNFRWHHDTSSHVQHQELPLWASSPLGYLQFGCHFGALFPWCLSSGQDVRPRPSVSPFRRPDRPLGTRVARPARLARPRYQLVDILWTFSQFCEGFAMVKNSEQTFFSPITGRVQTNLWSWLRDTESFSAAQEPVQLRSHSTSFATEIGWQRLGLGVGHVMIVISCCFYRKDEKGSSWLIWFTGWVDQVAFRLHVRQFCNSFVTQDIGVTFYVLSMGLKPSRFFATLFWKSKIQCFFLLRCLSMLLRCKLDIQEGSISTFGLQSVEALLWQMFHCFPYARHVFSTYNHFVCCVHV